MAEIAFENRRIFNFEGLVTWTLDRVILHTIVQHSSTCTYMPNFIEIEETLWTDGQKSRPNKQNIKMHFNCASHCKIHYQLYKTDLVNNRCVQCH